MKRNTLTSIALSVIILLMGACNSEAWDELPRQLVSFISEYFPGGELESYTDNGNGTEIVRIKNGATLTFDSDYEWTDVNGNGEILPAQFLYDCLPATLFRYLESMEMQNGVYRVSRTPDQIKVDLLDSVITYDQKTGTITE